MLTLAQFWAGPAHPADRKQSKCSRREVLNTSWQHSCWPWIGRAPGRGALRRVWKHPRMWAVRLARQFCALFLSLSPTENTQTVKSVFFLTCSPSAVVSSDFYQHWKGKERRPNMFLWEKMTERQRVALSSTEQKIERAVKGTEFKLQIVKMMKKG